MHMKFETPPFFRLRTVIVRYQIYIGKSGESLRRKAIGPVKWQPVALVIGCIARLDSALSVHKDAIDTTAITFAGKVIGDTLMTALDTQPAGRGTGDDREKLILDTLCQDYQSFFYLDFENEMVLVTKANDETRLFLDGDRTAGDFGVYREKLRDCFERYVDQASAPDFVEVLDPERLRDYLLRNEKLIYRFCAVTNGGRQRHLEVFAALIDEAGSGGVVGFRVIDKIIAQEERKKVELRRVNAQLKEQLHTIGGLSNAYFAVWWVDLEANTCKAIKNVPFFERAAAGLAAIDDVAGTFVDTCVQPEDQGKMRAFVDRSRMTELLGDTDIAVEQFHGTVDPWEWCRASWVVAARDAAGAVTSVLFALEDISSIVADQKQREREHMLLDEQTRVISGLSREYTTVWLVSGNGSVITKYRDSGRDNVAREDAYFAAESIGYDEALARYLGSYVCDEDKAEFARKVSFDAVQREIRRQPVYSVVFKRCYRDAREYFQVSFTAAGDEGGSDFVIGFKNVNHLVREERRRNEMLAEALDEAERANQAKTQFFSSMSHDIRTPMNAIIGFTSLALSRVGDAEAVEGYLRKISTSSEHLLSLINDVLDMSRIESGRVTIEEKPLNLPDLLGSITIIIQPAAEAKGLSFLVETEGVADVDVVADKLRLTQVLLNILGNGVKFTEAGGTLRLRVRQEPGAPEGYARYRFTVSDTGIGISEEFQKHIFESFSREKSATVSGIQGTGLGLAITKKVVDMMGGTIGLKSEEGQGSEFDVRLTFRLAAVGEAAGGEAAPAREQAAFNPEGKTILLVEDNELNQEIAVEVLRQAGFTVEVASDGLAAVGKLEGAGADRFDAVLMDIQMPVMDGYEATRRIRAMESPACKNMPIIAMTANAFEEDRRAAIAAGMNGHVAKPIDVGSLLKTLSEVMK